MSTTRVYLLHYKKRLLEFQGSEEFLKVPYDKEIEFIKELERVTLVTNTMAKAEGCRRVLMFQREKLLETFSDVEEASIMTGYSVKAIEDVLCRMFRAINGYSFQYLAE